MDDAVTGSKPSVADGRSSSRLGGATDHQVEETEVLLGEGVSARKPVVAQASSRSEHHHFQHSPSVGIDKDISFSSCGPGDQQPPRSHEARQFTQILAVAAVSFGASIYGTTIAFHAVAEASLKTSNRSTWDNSSFAESDTLNQSDGSSGGGPIARGECYNLTSGQSLFHSYTPEVVALPFVLYPNTLAYLASIPAIGTLFGSLFAGPISNWVGRKWTYVVGVCGTLSTGYILIALAQAQWMMLLGRFLHGAGVGFATTIATVYTMEIATPNLRGRLAAVPAVAGTLGILFCQILGAAVNWKVLSIVLASLNIPFLAFLLFIPESPVFLITTNQIDRAHKVLRVLRGPKWNITAELTDIKVAQDVHKQQERRSLRPRDFWARGVLRPFLIALALMFFLQFTGINIILNNTPNIFRLAGSTIHASLATIIVGVALLLSNTLTVIVADKMPRRIMLLLSAFGISATLIGMGVFMHLKRLEEHCCALDSQTPYFTYREDQCCASSITVARAAVIDGLRATDEICGIPPTVGDEIGIRNNGSARVPRGVSVPLLGPSNQTLLQPYDAQCQQAYGAWSMGNKPDCQAYTRNLGWLPMLLAMLYIFFYNLGYGAMIWMTVVEILPQHVRSVAASLSGGFACLWYFLTTHTYRYLVQLVTGAGVFWFYGCVSFLGLLFIAAFVPETKGKTEAEIQNHFSPSTAASSSVTAKRGDKKRKD